MKQTMEGKQVERVSKLNEKYRNYVHDVHNYFGNIRMLALKGETQKIVHIINTVEGELKEDIGGIVYCSSEVLNAILEDKKIKAEKADIDFEIRIERFLNLDFLEEADIISIFGNLLDNAIEAAEKCEGQNRSVKMKMYMGNPYMLITDIENTFCIKAKKDGERLISTKNEEGTHGLGINIVRKQAEKYGGSLEWEEKGNVFRSILSLSNMRE
ncbi:MAG: sensor histidine kinase [Clostridiales bacterium]|nr:sensor histidine kinase [Clostridiales bacterium]